MSGDLPPVPRPPVPIATLPLSRLLPPALMVRYLAMNGAREETFTAPCPHGVIVEWTAICDTGTASRAVCGCDCEEAA